MVSIRMGQEDVSSTQDMEMGNVTVDQPLKDTHRSWISVWGSLCGECSFYGTAMGFMAMILAVVLFFTFWGGECSRRRLPNISLEDLEYDQLVTGGYFDGMVCVNQAGEKRPGDIYFRGRRTAFTFLKKKYDMLDEFMRQDPESRKAYIRGLADVVNGPESRLGQLLQHVYGEFVPDKMGRYSGPFKKVISIELTSRGRQVTGIKRKTMEALSEQLFRDGEANRFHSCWGWYNMSEDRCTFLWFSANDCSGSTLNTRGFRVLYMEQILTAIHRFLET